ncbi:MAG: hypothetical protein JOZ19_03195 [Rubrobacter sp.]|nr:hypothetical protein [Rubrobacter sp.]
MRNDVDLVGNYKLVAGVAAADNRVIAGPIAAGTAHEDVFTSTAYSGLQ